jgi:GNAT superfamily N-acetyltransferase
VAIHGVTGRPEGHLLHVRRPGLEDAAALAAFAARTFYETFGADNRPADMAAYLSAAYGERQQRAEIASPDIVTLVIEQHDTLIAFAQVRRHPAPSCVTMPEPVELWRFYVDRPWHGQGVGHMLMDAALQAAHELGGLSVWLSVWERNPRAFAFYAKSGFQDVGSKVFIVGSDHQTDRVMARLLETSSV